MGGCASSNANTSGNTAGGNSNKKAKVLGALSDGDKSTYESMFIEDKVLGEGEFGQVKLVKRKSTEESSPQYFACKTLRKGPVFKDNTLYPPLPADMLRGEVEMMKTLNGKEFCLKLESAFETNKALLLVMDCCTGGEMQEYVADQPDNLRTEDVSRIAYQLLSAVNHCATNNIIHRDLKPQNTMFVSKQPGAELRVIDFGSGTNKAVPDGEYHTTFAGTPFYSSPELFQKMYTSKTDVWSCGVILYVLVAGYPAAKLQRAFNILQDSQRKDLKALPNMPSDMPESYYDMLNSLLTYRHKGRPTAGKMLSTDFCMFHKDLIEQEQEESGDQLPDLDAVQSKRSSARRSRMQRTSSMVLIGSTKRHSLYLDFARYERKLTTVLATVLSRNELSLLVSILEERLGIDGGDTTDTYNNVTASKSSNSTNAQLQVVSVTLLKDVIKLEIQNDECTKTIESLSNEGIEYDSYSYHIALLKEFLPREDKTNKISVASPKNGGSTAGAKSRPSGRRSMAGPTPSSSTETGFPGPSQAAIRKTQSVYIKA